MSFYNLNSSDISFLPVDRARGISYWPNYIKFKNRIFKEDITINEYEVESERTSDYYSVKVIVKNNKIVTKTSIFDNKKYDKFELKLIKIGISIFILSIILVFFYIIFLRKKNSNKVLYISHNILRK